jgi:DNA transposition AAA+ family ATPase
MREYPGSGSFPSLVPKKILWTPPDGWSLDPGYFMDETKNEEGVMNPYAAIIPTRAGNQALDFLETARLNRGEVSLLVGAPGSGKTTLVAEYARSERLSRRHPRAVLSLTCVPGVGALGLVQGLLDQVAPGFWARTARHGLARLVTALRREDVQLLVLDEAQHLYKTPLEMVRMLHQRTGISVVLCGEPGELRARLALVPVLRAHVHRVHTLEELAPEEAAAYAAAGLRQTAAAVLPLVEAARGNWDRLVRLVRECHVQAVRKPPVEAVEIQGAVRQMEERDERAA